MLDKSERLVKLAPQIADMIGLSTAEKATTERAAYLSKADLATQMVVDFTNLQGEMGYQYARRANEPEAVAAAIREHYFPASSGDALPDTAAGLALGLADRLDSLAGLIGVGLAPTGSADPYALRRQALGLVTILLDKGIDFQVDAALEKAAALMPVSIRSEALAEAQTFVQRRLEGLLRERGLAHDVVQAVLAERGDNPAQALASAQDLSAAIDAPNWDDMLNAYARCVRIVRNVEERYAAAEDWFVEPAEKALFQAYQKTKATLTSTSTLAEVIAVIRRTLVAPINDFFDNVLVMVEDEALRQNRLALLQDIRDLTKGYADFSQLQGF
jgi:glycyl-tRNA synthetase